jgi:hypothetical protein
MDKEHELEDGELETLEVKDQVTEEAPAKPEEPEDQGDDGLLNEEALRSLFSNEDLNRALGVAESGDGEEKGEDDAPEPEAGDEPGKEEKPDQPPSAKLNPRRLRPVAKVTEPAPVKPAEKPADKPDEVPTESFADSLDGDLKREYQMVADAEKYFPERFKGYPAKMEQYLKLLAKKHEDGDLPEDPDSEEFIEFERKHRPRMSQDDRMEVVAARQAERISQTSEAKLREQADRYEQQIRELRIKPMVDTQVEEFRKELVDMSDGAFSPEIVNEIESMGYEQALNEIGSVAQPYVNAVTLARAYAEIVADRNAGVQTAQKEIYNTISRIAVSDSRRHLAEAPNEELERDGRRFLPLDDYHRHVADMARELGDGRRAAGEVAKKYFTYTDKDIFKTIGRLATQSKRSVDDRLKKWYGAQPSSQKQEPAPVSKPQARTSGRPAGSGSRIPSSSPGDGQYVEASDDLKALGIMRVPK